MTAPNKRPSPSIWGRLRALAIKRDGHCLRCGTRWRRHLQVDHIKPLWEGGSNHLTNLATLCVACHSKKSAEEASRRLQREADAKTKHRAEWRAKFHAELGLAPTT